MKNIKKFGFNRSNGATPAPVSNESEETIALPKPAPPLYQMPTGLRIKLALYIFFMCFVSFFLGIVLTIFMIFHSVSGPLDIIQRPILAAAHLHYDSHKQWLDFNDAIQYADRYFYDREKIDYTKMYYAAAQAALQTLNDTYTFFEQPKVAQALNDNLNGHVGAGIGVETSIKQNNLTLVDVYGGSPAEGAGLKINDIILKVNGQDLPHTGDAGKDLSQDSQLLRGDLNTKVTLTIQRPSDNNRNFDVTITRADIQRPLIETKLIDGNIGYVKIKDSFGDKTADQFTTKVQQLVSQGATKFVLDVRDNGGGLVDAAQALLGHFLPGGTAFYEKAWDGQKIVENPSNVKPADTLKLYDAPLVVLVNGNSASASEITAGALQGRGRAALIGDKTFGKGVAQYVVPLDDGAAARVTYAHWLTPAQGDINGNGLQPDIKVAMTPTDSDAGSDPQLDRAVQFLYNNEKLAPATK